jgi:HEPN domain-containing protein
VNRIDFQNLAKERIAEAKILLDAQKWSGAYYLAGYAVEFGLKACIAKLTQPDEFPDKNFATKCWVHDIEQLVDLAGLKAVRNADAVANVNRQLGYCAWLERSKPFRTKNAGRGAGAI